MNETRRVDMILGTVLLKMLKDLHGQALFLAA